MLETNNLLINALIELSTELQKHDIQLIIGGGLSLYIRTMYFKKTLSPKYSRQVSQRSTKDIDVFLKSEIINDADKLEKIKDVLASLNYELKIKYFTYCKQSEEGKEVLVDFLAAPADGHDNNRTRIKNINVKNFNAHKNREAKGLKIGLIPVVDLQNKNYTGNIFIVSSFNYIIMKLKAFEDKILNNRNEIASYHALDIFSTIINMDENDWENAKEHFEKENEKEYIIKSCEVVKKYFVNENDIGIISLKENGNYKKDREEYDLYIKDFIMDLKELFNL